MPLPRQVLAEIFQSLDSIERLRKRRVCRLWEATLDAGAIGTFLWISCRHSFYKARTEVTEHFLLASCILQCATPATETILLEDSRKLSYLSRDVYGLLANLLQQQRIQLLVLAGNDFSDDDCNLHDYLDWINDHLSRVAATCPVVVWRDCELALTQTSAKVEFARFRLSDAPALRLTQLWDVYERSLVAREMVDVPRLAARVARCIRKAKKDISACKGILWVLNKYIGADPRTTHGAQQEWTMGNLSTLDVFKLTKVAQYALDSRVDDV
ncbi:uncharacterized protein LOC129590992 isoform X2 [Paramacrobiotus metropolitanus]|uniref:uncharacterized protein LOC129590992 isoform X2 n=1 Tax=Paramacrobiotus metropolitanus TaxID=2943436 RepID=UPI0024455E90|nr:uncharacterized protein LOC129590992 isoform X2 [Paramacrobiotus metropolitanus]